MTVAFVDENFVRWPVVAVCAAIELSGRTYYAARARPASARSVSDIAHGVAIKRVRENNCRWSVTATPILDHWAASMSDWRSYASAARPDIGDLGR